MMKLGFSSSKRTKDSWISRESRCAGPPPKVARLSISVKAWFHFDFVNLNIWCWLIEPNVRSRVGSLFEHEIGAFIFRFGWVGAAAGDPIEISELGMHNPLLDDWGKINRNFFLLQTKWNTTPLMEERYPENVLFGAFLSWRSFIRLEKYGNSPLKHSTIKNIRYLLQPSLRSWVFLHRKRNTSWECWSTMSSRYANRFSMFSTTISP